jgi:hydroxymethylbilane synthase
VDTRLRKLGEGAADALVLAAAGLERLGLAPEGAEALDVGACTPAPGQGLLAIEGRAGRADLAAALAPLDDPAAHACLRAERALLAGLGGGCMTPVGAYCAPSGAGRLAITAFIGEPDGSRGERVRVEGDAADPEALGARAAAKLR